MNTWQKVFEYMDGYTEQVDLVKIKLRQKQALGLLAGAIADELTGEALRPYLQNLVKVQTIYAMTIFRLEDIKPAMYQKDLVHNATPDVLVNYWLKNLEGGKFQSTHPRRVRQRIIAPFMAKTVYYGIDFSKKSAILAIIFKIFARMLGALLSNLVSHLHFYKSKIPVSGS